MSIFKRLMPPETVTLEANYTPRLDSFAAVAEAIEPEPRPIISAPDSTSPEYHLEFTDKMISTIGEKIKQAEIARREQRQVFEDNDASQAALIEGLGKSLKAYQAAREVLSPAPVPPARDVGDVEASPPARKPRKPETE